MTPEDELLLQQAIAKQLGLNKPSGGGMQNPYITPDQAKAAASDPSRKEARLQQQLAQAQQMQQTAMPDGRSHGNLYVASNPLEQLAAVANSGVGAMNARRLRGDIDALEPEYQRAAEAQAGIDAQNLNWGMAKDQHGMDATDDLQRLRERTQADTVRHQSRVLGQDAARMAQDQKQHEDNLGISQDKLDQAGKMFESEQDLEMWKEALKIESNAMDRELQENIAQINERRKSGVALEKDHLEQANSSVETLSGLQGVLTELENAQDALLDGANTGPVANMMPTLLEPSIRLRHARDQLALREIANYTFGSLSEAEGEWLKQTSIPLGMPEKELGAFLKKRADGVKRAITAEKYKLEMRRAGHIPDQDVVEDILYKGGFKFEDEE